MRCLNFEDLNTVTGGVSDDAAYGAAVGSAVGFLGMAFAVAATATPVGMAVLVGASIVSSAAAIIVVLE